MKTVVNMTTINELDEVFSHFSQEYDDFLYLDSVHRAMIALLNIQIMANARSCYKPYRLQFMNDIATYGGALIDIVAFEYLDGYVDILCAWKTDKGYTIKAYETNGDKACFLMPYYVEQEEKELYEQQDENSRDTRESLGLDADHCPAIMK